MNLSLEYRSAMAANAAAYKLYAAAAESFRACKLDDATFFLAQDAWKMAQVEFDVAFEAESNREEEPVAPIADEPDPQMSLLAEGDAG